MSSGSCHCGAVRIALTEPARELIDCNCSICRRVGALWTLLDAQGARFSGHPSETVAYVWGKKTIATFRCRHCGCVTHWEPLAGTPDRRIGVNMRMFDDDARVAARVRRFDGAVSWTYLE